MVRTSTSTTLRSSTVGGAWAHDANDKVAVWADRSMLVTATLKLATTPSVNDSPILRRASARVMRPFDNRCT